MNGVQDAPTDQNVKNNISHDHSGEIHGKSNIGSE